MSVMIDTSLGEVVVDLFCDEAPLASKNFLKLCKVKYYNGCLFYNVQQNFMIQTGDPTATGKGGTSLYGLIYGEQARFFEDEVSTTSRKHDEPGLLSMANMGVPNSNGSQFFFTMRGDDMQHLDGKHTVFAKVMEGMDVLQEINDQFCDDVGRPYRDIRILHTFVLDDPFDDPPQLVVPDESPLRDRPEEERVPLRIGATDKVDLEADEHTEQEREKELREKAARSNAVVLEMIGDLPDADMKPPENVLFVCKLNPVTTDDDLEIIFTRFGQCRAEICRDHITGDSLNYAFVEFDSVESCEEAFKKMNNVLIDDRRIKVDFSQSVAKEWTKYKGRAQGGQKLASGKGSHQKTPGVATKSISYTGSSSGRSRWGNSAAASGVVATQSQDDQGVESEMRRSGTGREKLGRRGTSEKHSGVDGSRRDDDIRGSRGQREDHSRSNGKNEGRWKKGDDEDNHRRLNERDYKRHRHRRERRETSSERDGQGDADIRMNRRGGSRSRNDHYARDGRDLRHGASNSHRHGRERESIEDRKDSRKRDVGVRDGRRYPDEDDAREKSNDRSRRHDRDGRASKRGDSRDRLRGKHASSRREDRRSNSRDKKKLSRRDSRSRSSDRRRRRL